MFVLEGRPKGGLVCAEWYFRSGLDRYVWIYGMLLAWVHPHIEAMWEAIERMSAPSRNLSRTAIACIACATLYVWCAPPKPRHACIAASAGLQCIV
jgi:hypothetical protein